MSHVTQTLAGSHGGARVLAADDRNAPDVERRSLDLIAVAVRRWFPGRIALVSAFGTESAVLLHLVARIEPSIPVLFIDSGQLFQETRTYRDALVRMLGLGDVRTVGPSQRQMRERDPAGDLWQRDPDACCRLRKVEPLLAGLQGFDAWINGRKRHHGAARSELPAIDDLDGRLTLNPLAAWHAGDVDGYFTRYGLPRHPLTAEGYASIGCRPCTVRVDEDASFRSGRWQGTGKTECGIHLPQIPAST